MEAEFVALRAVCLIPSSYSSIALGVVHTMGGFAALMGSIVLGPRIGRFDGVTDQRQFMQGHNPALYLLGTFLLWFAWCVERWW